MALLLGCCGRSAPRVRAARQAGVLGELLSLPAGTDTQALAVRIVQKRLREIADPRGRPGRADCTRRGRPGASELLVPVVPAVPPIPEPQPAPQPGCVDDAFEDDDAHATARPVELGTKADRRSCDADFFVITIDKGQLVEMTALPDAGLDLALDLFAAAAEDALADTADKSGAGQAETISFTNKTGLPLTLYARARAATTGAYTLTTLAAPAR